MLIRRLGTAARASRSEFEPAGAAAAAVAALARTLGSAASRPAADFDPAGAASGAISGHEGKSNPHNQYALKSSLGTAASRAAGDFATAAQGAKADTAIQSIPWASPGAIGATTPSSGKFTTMDISSSDPIVTLTATGNNRTLQLRPATGSIDSGNATLNFNRYSGLPVVFGGNSDTRLKVGQGYPGTYPALLHLANTVQNLQGIVIESPTGASVNSLEVRNPSGAVMISFTPSSSVVMAGPCRVGSFTVSTLPSAAANPGGIAFVSNDAMGATLAFSDGSVWRRVHDRMQVM